MTAIKVYRHAPVPAGATAPIRLHVPGWARSVWNALQRAGMRLVVLKHGESGYPADVDQLAVIPPTRSVHGRVLFSDD